MTYAKTYFEQHPVVDRTYTIIAEDGLVRQVSSSFVVKTVIDLEAHNVDLALRIIQRDELDIHVFLHHLAEALVKSGMA